MEENLIIEIQRIHKIMGVPQKLLVEGGVTPTVIDFIKGFFKEVKIKQGPKNTFEVGGSTLSKSEYNSIKDAINDPQTYFDNLPLSSKKIISNIIGQNQSYVDDLYGEIVKDILTQKNLTEEGLIKGIMKEMKDNNRTLEDELKILFNDDFLADLFYSKFQKLKNDVLQKKYKPTETLVQTKKELGSGLKTKIKKAADTGDIQGSKDLNRFKKFLASNKTIFNVFRRACNDLYIKFEKKTLDKVKQDETFIQQIYGDIVRTSDKIVGGTKPNVDEIVIELRDISQKLKRISDENQSDFEKLVDEFQTQMKEKNLGPSSDAEFNEFFTNLKQYNPFRENSTTTEKSWALREWLNTSTSNTFESILNLRFLISKQYEKCFQAIGDLISRIPLFLLTSSPKSFKEFSQYFTEYGALKGFWKLYQHLWLATKIGMPVFYALYDVVVNLMKLRFTKTEGEEGKFKDAFDEFWGRYFQQLGQEYKWRGSDEFSVGSVIAGILAPGHLVGKDLIDWFTKKTAKIESGKARPEITAQDMFNIAREKGVILSKEAEESLKEQLEEFKQISTEKQKEWLENKVKEVENKFENVKSQAENVLNKIEGSEAGCKAFLVTKGKDMKSYLNEICIATDGTKYEWDGTKYIE